jgi:DnaK suppressor protein
VNTSLDQIKKKLIKRKSELEEVLNQLGKDTVYDEQTADPSDQASVSTLEDINISLQNTEREEYTRILKALEMLEDGSYGVCIDCGQPISEKRLQLYPNAARCIICQEAAEEKTGNIAVL